MIRVHAIRTRATIQTRIGRTVIDVCFTIWPSESTSTSADEATKRICARPTVFTWIAHTFVDVVVTQLTLPPRLAFTLIPQVVCSVGADGIIGARVGGARGEDVSTSGSRVRRLADASEACHTIHTSPFV